MGLTTERISELLTPPFNAKRLLVCWFSVVAFAIPNTASANLVFSPGFEGSEVIEIGLPNSPMDWRGDTIAVVTAENGITPPEGTHMVHFIDTGLGVFGGGSASEMYQLFDASAFAAEIATGRAVVRASFLANRVAGDATTDTRFIVIVNTYGGAMANFPTEIHSNRLDQQVGTTDSDSAPSTWEEVSIEAPLPAGVSYFALGIAAIENVVNNVGSPEFTGHYGDAFSLEVVVLPLPQVPALSNLSLIGLAFGLLGVGCIAQRHTSARS